MYSSFVGQTSAGGKKGESGAGSRKAQAIKKKELLKGVEQLPDLDLNQPVLEGMATVTRVITDTSFTIYHEHFKTDFRVHRIPDNENLDAWINCQTHSNIVTCLDNFKAKGPDGQVRHFSMTETSSEGHSNPNMYQFIESLNLNLAIDVPRYYLELIYDMGIQLATALDFAHNSGLVHGQLDLSKVVIQKEGDNLIFKITDFAPTSQLDVPTSSEAHDWPFARTKNNASHHDKLEALMLKDIYTLGICLLEMMIGRISKKKCSITLDSVPLTWAEFPESTPLCQVLVECINIDSTTHRKGKLQHIRKLLIREYKKFFQRTFYKMEKPYTGKKWDVYNKRGIVAFYRGKQEEALRLWSEALDLYDRHFDAQVNFSMHRWSSGQITDAQLMSELSIFVFDVQGKGEILHAALLIATGEKDDGLELLKQIVDRMKVELKQQRLVNLKVKKQLEIAQGLLSAVQIDKAKFIQNYKVLHQHTGTVASLAISMNSEFLCSIANDECHVFMIKNAMMQKVVSISRTLDDSVAYSEDVKPLACVDNAGSICCTYRGGGLRMSVWIIESLNTVIYKETIDVVKELKAVGQPGFKIGKDDRVLEMRFLAGESAYVRISLAKGGEHYFIDVQLSEGVPNMQKVKFMQDKSVFNLAGAPAKKLQEQLTFQMGKEQEEGNLVQFPEKETNSMVVLNKADPTEKHFLVYELLRNDYSRRVQKRSMDDEAFAVDDQCNILVHVESDTLYFDLVKMPNSLELTNILRPRYQIAETKMNPALASEKKQGFRDKIYRDLHTYFMFKADPQKAEKESGVTDVQNTQLMICKYEEACTQRYKLKANREFMMLQKILLRDAGIMGQTRRNLLDQSPLVSINGIKRIEIYDDELTFQSRNQTIDKVQISSESHRNFFLLAMDGIIYKYDLVTKEPLFQFRSIHSPAMSLYDKDDKLCVCSDSEIRLWDFFDHREEAPELISIEITPIKIELAWINKNSKEFQGLFVSGREYIFYTGRLKKIFHDSLEDEIATITSAEFSYDEKALFLGTSRGKIIRLDAETGKQEGNAITVQDDKKITHLVRFKGMQDQNVFLCVSGKKELYVYSESRSSVEPIDFGGEHDSEVYIGLNITDVAVSDNAKFFVIGIPEKKAFGVFTFNRTNFISKPIRWITDISFEHFFADDLLSTVLFMDTTKKTLDHHFLLWRFDTTKLDHKALHKLDVGLLPGGEFQEGETDYGTEGDESPGFEGVERSNNSQCCIMF